MNPAANPNDSSHRAAATGFGGRQATPDENLVVDTTRRSLA